ncbi:MAG: HEAT repeat domain-containing protein, partial [Halobacteriales archaeon]
GESVIYENVSEDDAETIASLLETTDDLSDAIWDATEWTDLEVRERLDRYGFYDVLDHRKDFPPEWHAIKVFEKQGRADKILIALELMGSDFMEEHCIEALKRMGAEEALDPMLQRAGRRDLGAIEVLGKIGSEEAVDTLVDYVDSDNPELQRVSLRALGEIGSEAAVQPIANQLVADSETVRSNAARTLGLIGDTRAIDPLADLLDDTDEPDNVRASAAWALRQIGTERALEHLAEYADDDAALISAEAERVA